MKLLIASAFLVFAGSPVSFAQSETSDESSAVTQASEFIELFDELELGDLVDSSEPPPDKPEVDPNAPRMRDEIAYGLYSIQGSVFAFYNRALRRNPGIGGTVVFSFEVFPDGHVSNCEVVESEISDQKMLDTICRQVSNLVFERLNVDDSTVVRKRIQFVPP